MSHHQLTTLIRCTLLSGFSFFSIQAFALSATTANTIQGNGPRFIASIEDSIEQSNEFDYFGVSYKGVNYFSTTDLNVALGANVSAKTPANLGVSKVINQVASEDVFDVDGDYNITLSEAATNSVTLDWYYKDTNDNEIKLTTAQTNTVFSTLVKNGIYPYIKVSGTVALNTAYGDPFLQSYPDSNIAITKTPYRNFNVLIGGEAVKYASPEMLYSSGIYTKRDTTKFDPTTRNGFIPQDDYLTNFPTTGANGLYFYLVTNGIDNSLDTTKWIVRTSNSDNSSANAITATITKSKAPGTSGFKTYDSTNMVLVTLKGPDASTKSSAQASAATAELPVDFELIGTTKQDITLSYKFRITKWFINRGNNTYTQDVQKAWCQGLGNYQLATVRELSNARLDSLNDTTNTYYNYQRAVNEGLITEWGRLAYFTGAEFYNTTYGWTSTVSPSTGNPIYVNMNDAALNQDRPSSYNYYALCVSKS